MHDDRGSDALTRIDRALDRIEAGLSALPPPASGSDGELERLRAAHTLLRERVEEALGAIDHMLEER